MKTYQRAISLGLLFSAQPAHSDEETILIIKLGFYTIHKLIEYFGNHPKNADNADNADKKITDGKAGSQQVQSPQPVTVNVQPTRDMAVLEKTEKAVNIVAAGMAGYEIYLRIHDHSNKTAGQNVQNELAKLQLEKLKAERAIRKCLAYNDEGEMNSEGMPRICSEEFKAFIAVATQQEVHEIKDGFRNR